MTFKGRLSTSCLIRLSRKAVTLFLSSFSIVVPEENSHLDILLTTLSGFSNFFHTISSLPILVIF